LKNKSISFLENLERNPVYSIGRIPHRKGNIRRSIKDE
jgi:hypothetical protein